MLSKGISEAYIQVDRIHGESHRIEIFPEDIVQPPGQVCTDVQVLECTPFSPDLRPHWKRRRLSEKS